MLLFFFSFVLNPPSNNQLIVRPITETLIKGLLKETPKTKRKRK